MVPPPAAALSRIVHPLEGASRIVHPLEGASHARRCMTISSKKSNRLVVVVFNRAVVPLEASGLNPPRCLVVVLPQEAINPQGLRHDQDQDRIAANS